MENKLVEILATLDLEIEYEVYLQNSKDSEDEYPEHYFTYWNWDNARSGYYDNKHNKNYVGYQIVAYSTDRKIVNKMIRKAIEELEKNGFEIDEDETDISTSDKTYTALVIDVYFIKKKEE